MEGFFSDLKSSIDRSREGVLERLFSDEMQAGNMFYYFIRGRKMKNILLGSVLVAAIQIIGACGSNEFTERNYVGYLGIADDEKLEELYLGSCEDSANGSECQIMTMQQCVDSEDFVCEQSVAQHCYEDADDLDSEFKCELEVSEEIADFVLNKDSKLDEEESAEEESAEEESAEEESAEEESAEEESAEEESAEEESAEEESAEEESAEEESAEEESAEEENIVKLKSVEKTIIIEKPNGKTKEKTITKETTVDVDGNKLSKKKKKVKVKKENGKVIRKKVKKKKSIKKADGSSKTVEKTKVKKKSGEKREEKKTVKKNKNGNVKKVVKEKKRLKKLMVQLSRKRKRKRKIKTVKIKR